jgi:hypothetical protein
MNRNRAPAPNERFGTMAGAPRWIGGENQQVKCLVASAGSPPLRQAAGTLVATRRQRSTERIECEMKIVIKIH